MRRAVAASGALMVLLAVAGCTQGAGVPAPVPSNSSSASAPPADAPPFEASVALVPGGTASDNLPFFDQTVESLLAATSDPDGRTIIDALVSAGFDKAAMELTADTTAIGLDADNLQFTVKFPDACVVGQFGNVGFHSVVLPELATGRCLVGQTRSIDW